MRSALAFVLVLLTLPARAEDAGTSVVEDAGVPRFEGHFVVTDRDAAEAATRASVQDAVRGLNPRIREVYATELARMLAVRRDVLIEAPTAEGALTVTLDGHAFTAPLDGTPRPQAGPASRRITVVHRMQGQVFAQEERTQNGTRTNVYAFEPDGTLLVTTRFVTPLLPRPIETVARYRRASP